MFVLLHVQPDDSGTTVVDSTCTIMMVEGVYTFRGGTQQARMVRVVTSSIQPTSYVFVLVYIYYGKTIYS